MQMGLENNERAKCPQDNFYFFAGVEFTMTPCRLLNA